MSAFISGDNVWMSIQTTSTGAFLFTYGNGSRVSFTTPLTYNDGKEHKLAVSCGPSGGKFFVDGILVGSNATTYLNSGPTQNVPTGIGCWYKKVYTAVPGITSEVIWWAVTKYNAAYTPRSVPLSAQVATIVGVTDGLVLYAPLNGTLNTFV